jgi:hypothetical protein
MRRDREEKFTGEELSLGVGWGMGGGALCESQDPGGHIGWRQTMDRPLRRTSAGQKGDDIPCGQREKIEPNAKSINELNLYSKFADTASSLRHYDYHARPHPTPTIEPGPDEIPTSTTRAAFVCK